MLRHLVLCAGALVLFYVLTVNLSSYHNYQVGLIALFAMVIAGLSVLTGINGQISLGHGAFMAVGAYTFALVQEHVTLPLALELLAAVAASAVLGLVVGIPATRLRGPYLAGMTLILALGLPQLADKYNSVFGGDEGLHPSQLVAPGAVDPNRWFAWITVLVAVIVVALLANLVRSHFGRAMRAVRDNEVAAMLAGIHVGRTKVLAFVVSAGCAGLAGAFLALSGGVVTTGDFPLSLSIYLVAAMVLGGAGSLVGPWWGAIAIVYLPQWSTSISSDFGLGSAVAANLALVIFGLVLIIVMMLAPTGVQGGVRWLARRLLAARFPRPPAAAGVTAVAGFPEPPAPATPDMRTEQERTHP